MEHWKDRRKAIQEIDWQLRESGIECAHDRHNCKILYTGFSETEKTPS